MEFDRCKVYHTLNADRLKVGSKIFVADTLEELRNEVKLGTKLYTLETVLSDDSMYRFDVGPAPYALAYLVKEPAKLKWSDLKIGDVIRKGISTRMVTGIEADDEMGRHILIGGRWLEEDKLAEWEKVEK